MLANSHIVCLLETSFQPSCQSHVAAGRSSQISAIFASRDRAQRVVQVSKGRV